MIWHQDVFMEEKKKNLSREKQLAKLIESLPKGYISIKRIGGKDRFYLQWREQGKVKSKYIKPEDLDELKSQIQERKRLEKELERIKLGIGNYPKHLGELLMTNHKVAEESFVYKVEPSYYLKWGNHIIGEIYGGLSGEFRVVFTDSDYNATVSLYTKGKDRWTDEEFQAFLSGRIVSKDRRDIEKILYKLELADYDVKAIALATRAINAKDLIWISKSKKEKMEDAVSQVFESIFFKKKDLKGDSVDSPEGYNVKRYGVYKGYYGIYKQRISPLSTDVESELAVYGLAKLLGVSCCPCYRVDENTIFSQFEYDWTKEHIVHFRQILSKDRKDNQLLNLIAARPEYFSDFARMIALDFVTRQDDRHLSNIAVKMSLDPKTGEGREAIYPLYDNGRSLFYEDPEETVMRAVKDIKGYSTAFGPSGTYWDYVEDLKGMGIDFSRLLNLRITKKEIKSVLKEAGLTGYRLDGSLEWIWTAIEFLGG